MLFWIFTCFFPQDENPDLFYAVPWSHGTLGFLVSAEIQIIPAKKYVKLEYQPVHSQSELARLMGDNQTYEQNQFVEALVYSRTQSVFMTGNMTDEVEADKVSIVVVALFG